MSFNLAFVGAAGECATFDADADSLMSSLLDLLDRAGTEIERDAETAKVAIRRASSLLRIEMERKTRDAGRDTSLGKLAAWQVCRANRSSPIGGDGGRHRIEIAAPAP
jgi:hypothetical protein